MELLHPVSAIREYYQRREEGEMRRLINQTPDELRDLHSFAVDRARSHPLAMHILGQPPAVFGMVTGLALTAISRNPEFLGFTAGGVLYEVSILGSIRDSKRVVRQVEEAIREKESTNPS